MFSRSRFTLTGKILVFIGTCFLACSQTRAESPSWAPGLSDRELAVQRWFSWLTFLNDREKTPWPQWFDDGNQLGTTSLRYQIAFAGYGCAAMAAKTPAYHEVGASQLDDLCRRLIDVRTWYYVTKYWRYGSNPPDPCLFDNVMYTGHLTQLMCLYELLCGDSKYNDAGWDFTWRDGRKTHYTLEKAVKQMHRMSVASPNGGICCEPGLIFNVCNSHSAISFIMFDLLHGTHYADANKKWFDWMSKNFRVSIPGNRDFFKMVLHQKIGLFAPVTDLGSDGWALSWGFAWYPTTDLAKEGWEHVKSHAEWVSPAPDQIHAKGSELVTCCASGTLPVRNAFLPLVAVQAEGANSEIGRKLLKWFEARFGREIDTDGDGLADAYCYHTCDMLKIIVTGNIAAALATDGDSLRRFYNTSRKEILAAPMLSHVDYPNVYVRSAEYRRPVLRFAVLKGRPGFNGKTDLICTHIPEKFSVTRDGQPYTDFKFSNSTLTISTDVDQEHVFEITTNSPLPLGEGQGVRALYISPRPLGEGQGVRAVCCPKTKVAFQRPLTTAK